MGSEATSSPENIQLTFYDCYDKDSKTPITVTGEYLNLDPKFKSIYSQEDVDPLTAAVVKWFETHSHKNWRKILHEELWGAVDTSARIAVHCMPSKTPDSPEAYFICRWMTWTWLYDEPIEARYKDVPFTHEEMQGMRDVHTHLIDIIWAGGKPKTERPTTSSIWTPDEVASLFNLMEDVMKDGVKILGAEYFYKECHSVARALRMGFDGNEWYMTTKFEKNYGLQAMRTFRGYNLLSLWMIDVVAFICKRPIHNEAIRKHIMFFEIEKACQSSMYIGNDLLGLRRDFCGHNEPVASEVYYRITKQGMTLQQAVTATCDDHTQLLKEYRALKDGLLLIFGNDQQLIDFCEVIEANLWGQHLVYADNPRYQVGTGKSVIKYR